MIDFSPAYKEGLIVHCRTEEDSLALFREAKYEFRDITHNLNMYTEDYLRSFHKRRADLAAYRFSMVGNNQLHVSRASINWYRSEPAYESCKIIEYCNSVVDYGVDFDEEINISFLFGGDLDA